MPGENPQPYVWMLLGSFCFAGMGVLAHLSGESYPWQVVAIGRSLVPFLLVLAWSLVAGVQLVFWRPGVLWMRSISGSISLVSTFYALTCLPPPEVFTITNMFPVWVALLSWPLLGEVPTASVWISILCGVTGVCLIHPPDFLFHTPTDNDWPVLIAVLASFSTALAMLGLNQLRSIDTRAVVVHFSFTALVFSTAAFFLFERKTPDRPADALAFAAVLGTGLTATAGQIFLTKAFTSGQASKVAVVNLAQIPLTLVFDVVLFDRSLDARKLLGMALVLGPTAWLMWSRKLRKPRPEETALEQVPLDEI